MRSVCWHTGKPKFTQTLIGSSCHITQQQPVQVIFICSCLFMFIFSFELLFLTLFCHTGELCKYIVIVRRIWSSAGVGFCTLWPHDFIAKEGSMLHTFLSFWDLFSHSYHSLLFRLQNVAASSSSSTPPCPLLKLRGNWRTGMTKSWSTLRKRKWVAYCVEWTHT